ncbi:hypothetical protein PTKIN_Ptkin19aG0087200 [Pterospermum kingtungense]
MVDLLDPNPMPNPNEKKETKEKQIHFTIRQNPIHQNCRSCSPLLPLQKPDQNIGQHPPFKSKLPYVHLKYASAVDLSNLRVWVG